MAAIADGSSDGDGRANVLLSSDESERDAELFGYVNRALPDDARPGTISFRARSQSGSPRFDNGRSQTPSA